MNKKTHEFEYDVKIIFKINLRLAFRKLVWNIC